MSVIDFASKQINSLDDYDIFINEIHHHRKKDSPSGTALTLAETIIGNINEKNRIITDKIDHEIEKNQLHVSSTRGGEVTGIHTVYIDSFADTIELTHRAKNRSGFAAGALQAAIWLGDKKGIFNFADIINEILDL
jgi:4-hydroxy-tetrahydrodipicolinate reductase